MVAIRPRFIKKPKESCDFLKQTSTRIINETKTGKTTITINVTLPPYVLPYYWKRYLMSFNDVVQQTERIPAKLYWMSALLYGVDVCASALKPSYSCLDNVIVINKITAIKKILKAQKITLSSLNVMQPNMSLKHIPPPPTLCISMKDMKFIRSIKHEDCKAFDILDVSDVFKLNETKYIPIDTQGDCIIAKRLVLLSDFEKSGKQQAKGFATRPLIVRVKDSKEMFALVEDVVCLKQI